MNPRAGEVHYSRSLEAENFPGLGTDFHEVLDGGLSCRQPRDGEFHQHARLDHVYTNPTIQALLANGCYAKYAIPNTSQQMTSACPFCTVACIACRRRLDGLGRPSFDGVVAITSAMHSVPKVSWRLAGTPQLGKPIDCCGLSLRTTGTTRWPCKTRSVASLGTRISSPTPAAPRTPGRSSRPP